VQTDDLAVRVRVCDHWIRVPAGDARRTGDAPDLDLGHAGRQKPRLDLLGDGERSPLLARLEQGPDPGSKLSLCHSATFEQAPRPAQPGGQVQERGGTAPPHLEHTR